MVHTENLIILFYFVGKYQCQSLVKYDLVKGEKG